jgi:hypothetical protein
MFIVKGIDLHIALMLHVSSVSVLS